MISSMSLPLVPQLFQLAWKIITHAISAMVDRMKPMNDFTTPGKDSVESVERQQPSGKGSAGGARTLLDLRVCVGAAQMLAVVVTVDTPEPRQRGAPPEEHTFRDIGIRCLDGRPRHIPRHLLTILGFDLLNARKCQPLCRAERVFQRCSRHEGNPGSR
jgi:hypothetical protein